MIERVGGQDVLDFVVCRFGDVGVNRLASFFVIDDEIDRFDGGGVIIFERVCVVISNFIRFFEPNAVVDFDHDVWSRFDDVSGFVVLFVHAVGNVE